MRSPARTRPGGAFNAANIGTASDALVGIFSAGQHPGPGHRHRPQPAIRQQARWLLHDTTLDPEDRAAALLVLRYAQWPSAVSRLTLDHVHAGDDGAITTPTAAAKLALRTLACRHQALSAEMKDRDTELDRLTTKTAARLAALFGVGTDSVGTLLVAADDNPDRLRSEAAFSMLWGLPDRGPLGQDHPSPPQPWRRPPGQHRAVPHRAGAPALRPHHPAYMARRLAQGKSRREVIRCLKRYVAREVFAALCQINLNKPAAAA